MSDCSADDERKDVPETDWGEIRPGYRWGKSEIISGQYRAAKWGQRYVDAKCDCGKVRRVAVHYIRRGEGGQCLQCSVQNHRDSVRVGTLLEDGVKLCCYRECRIGKPQPAENFGRSLTTPDGLVRYCRDCNVRLMRLRKYGLSHDDYDAKKKLQGNRCAICGDDEGVAVLNRGGWCIDHDHATGLVRDLLCNRCNTAEGNLRGDPRLAVALALYHFRHNGGSPAEFFRDVAEHLESGVPTLPYQFNKK